MNQILNHLVRPFSPKRTKSQNEIESESDHKTLTFFFILILLLALIILNYRQEKKSPYVFPNYLCSDFIFSDSAFIKASQLKNMIKAGILGGGQLGRMLLQCAANYPVETYILENDTQSPAAHLCHHFIKGDINNYEDVYAFGKMVDVLTIEIEHVNLDALEQLEKEGLTIIPKTETLKTIKNKISQKAFYTDNLIPTTPYLTTESKVDLANHIDFLPAVHKTALGGYDGK
ncbi:MAG: hypothetical protein RL582_722, partial [Bacteroidota bacterium]